MSSARLDESLKVLWRSCRDGAGVSEWDRQVIYDALEAIRDALEERAGEARLAMAREETKPEAWPPAIASGTPDPTPERACKPTGAAGDGMASAPIGTDDLDDGATEVWPVRGTVDARELKHDAIVGLHKFTTYPPEERRRAVEVWPEGHEARVRAEERERCAAVAECLDPEPGTILHRNDIAAAIRALK